MPEMTAQMPTQPESTSFDAASLARLRTLSSPGFSPKALVKSVSPFEISALVLLVVLVVGTLVVYVVKIAPDQLSYLQMSSQASANRTKIEELQRTIVDPNVLTSHFQEVRDSLETFRGSVLKPRPAGRVEILDAIGRATRETGVRLADAVHFDTHQIGSAIQDESKTKDKVRKGAKEGEISSYPSLAVQFSVTGSYDQLRAFVARFESSGQFVVIDAVALNNENADEGDGARGRGAAVGRSGGSITLDITMTAYFQPEATQVVPVFGAQ